MLFRCPGCFQQVRSMHDDAKNMYRKNKTDGNVYLVGLNACESLFRCKYFGITSRFSAMSLLLGIITQISVAKICYPTLYTRLGLLWILIISRVEWTMIFWHFWPAARWDYLTEIKCRKQISRMFVTPAPSFFEIHNFRRRAFWWTQQPIVPRQSNVDFKWLFRQFNIHTSYNLIDKNILKTVKILSREGNMRITQRFLQKSAQGVTEEQKKKAP